MTIPQNYSEISSDTIAVLFFEDEYPLMMYLSEKKQGYKNRFSLTISRQCFPLSFFQCFLQLHCKRWEKNRKNCNMGLKKVNIVTKFLSSYTASMRRSLTLCQPQCVFLHQKLHQFLLQMLVY